MTDLYLCLEVARKKSGKKFENRGGAKKGKQSSWK